MSEISIYLDEIQNAVYGEEVRSAIINAINQCYEDAAEGVAPEIIITPIENGNSVNIKYGNVDNIFNVYNGLTPSYYVKEYTSPTYNIAAGGFGTVTITTAYPEGYDTQIGVIGTGACGAPITTYPASYNTTDGGNLTVYFQNPTNYTVEFTVKVAILYMKMV